MHSVRRRTTKAPKSTAAPSSAWCAAGTTRCSRSGCRPRLRLAIAQARVYDRAADECFLGFFASRRNYDVAQGIDAQGRWRSGVLEQSWRLGGASGAEIAAIEAFCADPNVNAVRAVSREVYGDCPSPPDDAAVYFRGVDPNVGPLTKYARVECDAHAR